MDELKDYAKAVGKHWLILLGTSILGLVWAVAQQQHFLCLFLTPSFLVPPAVGFVSACFLAWRDEHRAAKLATNSLATLRGELSNKKAKGHVVDVLMARLTEGEQISAWQLFVDDDFREFRAAAKKWTIETVKEMELLKCSEVECHSFESPSYTGFQQSPPFTEYADRFGPSKELWDEEKRYLLFRLHKLRTVIDLYTEVPILTL
jgi:hypothetical protein